MSDIQFVGGRRESSVRFSVEPVYSALCSLCLLSQDHLDRISSWVDATKQHLSDEERKMAEAVCHAAPYVALTGARNLEEFIEALSNVDPTLFMRTTSQRIVRKAQNAALDSVPRPEDLATNEDKFVDLVRRLCEQRDCMDKFDEEEERAEFRKLSDGPEYRRYLTEAIRTLWKKYLGDEWDRVLPAAEASVAGFQSVDVPGGDFAEQLLFITERDELPDEWLRTLGNAEDVVFIPSVHIGPFMILLEYDGHTVYVVGRARTPEGSSVHTSELDRSDLLIRLEALSDDTRLRVLELGTEMGEITTADVMDRLELSQSSASRHLTQLTATGLLSVDASERTKRYRVNAGRVEQVFSGLKTLIGTTEKV